MEKHLPAQLENKKKKKNQKAVEWKQDPSEENPLSFSLNAGMARALSGALNLALQTE